eukprot:Colp12_sorted_trinity150504_noHs@6574
MICIILVAGHGARLEAELRADTSGKYADLVGVPKALLPGLQGKPILDLWWEAMNVRQLFSDIYIVTNADKFKYYERWATAHDFPPENIINDGTTTYDARLGSIVDFDLVLRSKKAEGHDCLVVAGDMLFWPAFDIASVVRYFQQREGELAVYYELPPEEHTHTRGMVELDHTTGKISRFLEKPTAAQTSSRLASVVFYCFRKQSYPLLRQYIADHPAKDDRVFGKYMEWLVTQSPVYGMKLPSGFQLIGQSGLLEYERWVGRFSDMEARSHKNRPITKRANFKLRQKIFGDDVIGKANLRMIEIAENFGVSAKFPGSGGGIVGMCPNRELIEKLKHAYEEEGFVFTEIIPNV